MFVDSLMNLLKPVANIVATPVEIAVDVASAIAQPVSDACDCVKQEIKDLTK